MIQQDLLFDGQQRKEIGQQSVLRNASEIWKEEAFNLIQGLSDAYDEFSSDDLRGLIHPPEHPNAYGAMFSAMAKMKVIKKTGRYIKSKTPSCHSRIIATWQRY